MQDVVRILTPVAIFFAGTLFLALMRNIMEEPSETNITVEELIRREYGDCAFSMIKHLYLMESCIDISTIKMVGFMFFMKRMLKKNK